MKKGTIHILSLLFSIAILTGCSNANNHVEEGLYKYKNSYVGDNGAVGNITRQLPKPTGEQLNGIELKTKDEPYGVVLNYKNKESSEEGKKDYRETALYNATVILALVDNADWVTFNFVEDQFTVQREDLQTWYEKDIREFNNEEELIHFMQSFLEDNDKVSQFYNRKGH